MKKILTVVLGCCLLAGCASVKEAQNLANCKFALRNVELTDYNLTTLGFTVVIAITNLNKKQAENESFRQRVAIIPPYFSPSLLKSDSNNFRQARPIP